MKKVLLILLCLLLIAGGGFVIVSLLDSKRIEQEELRACTVFTGGGMRGGTSRVSLSKDENGNAVLSVSEKETYADRLVTTVYLVEEAAFDNVKALAVRHHLYSASKRPYSKMRVMDADSTSLSFDFEKNDFSVSEEQVMSRKMREGFRAVIDYLSSLPSGEGVTTKAPQEALLYLKSGYTLQFIVEDVFDGRLDPILGNEHAVSAYQNSGILLVKGEAPALSGAVSVESAEAGTIVYSPKEENIILLYRDMTFPEPVYVLARLDGHVSSAAPLIAEMQGDYSFSLN